MAFLLHFPIIFQAKLSKLDVRGAVEHFDKAGKSLMAAVQLADLGTMSALWNTDGATLLHPALAGTWAQDLEMALERLGTGALIATSSAGADTAASALRLRCRALLLLLSTVVHTPEQIGDSEGRLKSAADPLHILEDVWQMIENSGDLAGCNVILQAMGSSLAISGLEQSLRQAADDAAGEVDKKSPSSYPEATSHLLMQLHCWLDRLGQTTARLCSVLESAAQGREPCRNEESVVLDGCWSLLGVSSRPGSSLLQLRPAALLLIAQEGDPDSSGRSSTSLPWIRHKLHLMADGTQGLALADAATTMLQLIQHGVLREPLQQAARVLHRICDANSADSIWAGPFSGLATAEAAGQWAAVRCHAALLLQLQPLRSKSNSSKKSSSGSKLSPPECLLRTLLPCMWTAQDKVPLYKFLRQHGTAVGAAMEATFVDLLQVYNSSAVQISLNPKWTLKNSILLLLSCPFANPSSLINQLQQRILPIALGQKHMQSSIPLMPSSVDAVGNAGEAIRAEKYIFWALDWLRFGTSSSPLRCMEEWKQNQTRQDMPKPHFGIACCGIEAALAIYYHVNNWVKAVGYPSPLLLLDLVERSVALSCGVVKRWHGTALPRQLAIQNLGPLQPLLALWSLHPAANINNTDKATLEVNPPKTT